MFKAKQKTFNHGNVVNFFIVYELDIWSHDLNTDFTLDEYLFGVLKVTKSTDADKYRYSGYGTGLDAHSSFLFSNGDIDKNVILGADISSLRNT